MPIDNVPLGIMTSGQCALGSNLEGSLQIVNSLNSNQWESLSDLSRPHLAKGWGLQKDGVMTITIYCYCIVGWVDTRSLQNICRSKLEETDAMQLWLLDINWTSLAISSTETYSLYACCQKYCSVLLSLCLERRVVGVDAQTAAQGYRGHEGTFA